VGGPWLCSTLVPSGLVALTVPSGSKTMPHPQRCTAIRWWNEHYADVLVMPMSRLEPLVAALRVAGRSA
jgi:hypothetical protein